MPLPLSTDIPVAFFVITGGISFYSSMKQLKQDRDKRNVYPWYKQFQFLLGITCFLLAVFFLLIGIHDVVPEQNTTVRLLVYVFAGIVIVSDLIVSFYMLGAYLLSVKLKR